LMGDKANTVSVVGKLFKENGFEEVFCLDGGIESWIDAGLPVRTAEK
jgi:rhodanese-related sulfurtransferase